MIEIGEISREMRSGWIQWIAALSGSEELQIELQTAPGHMLATPALFLRRQDR